MNFVGKKRNTLKVSRHYFARAGCCKSWAAMSTPPAPGEQGYTPLHISTKFNYPEIVELLLRSGARTDMITRDEKTARDLAVLLSPKSKVLFFFFPQLVPPFARMVWNAVPPPPP